MRCLGRTKKSNYLKRCSNNTLFLFCWHHVWQPFMVIVSIIVFGAAIAELSGYNLRGIFYNQEKVEPNISCFIENPIKANGEKFIRNKTNPDIVIKNDGPIEAVSVSADIKFYNYNEITNNIDGFFDFAPDEFSHSISAQELKPFKELRKQCIGLKGEGLIGVYYVAIIYHRKPDMKQFTSEEYFFTKQGEILSPQELKKTNTYDKIFNKIASYKTDNNAGLHFTYVPEHNIWFTEPFGAVATRLNPDGSLTGQKPKFQGEFLKKGYPYLDIRPVRFEETGFFINANKSDDEIRMKIRYAFKNIGDTSANITKDGFNTVLTIEPGKVFYRTDDAIAKVWLKGDSKLKLDDGLRMIDNGEKSFTAEFNTYYRPANAPDELFKVFVKYIISKNSFTPVLPTSPD